MICKLFYVQLLAALLAVDGVSANFATKKIPDHLMKRFPLVDPNRKHVPKHNIQPHQFVPPVMDPHKRKTEKEVPREPEHTIHTEDMHPDDHVEHEKHYGVAKTAHLTSIRKRDRMDREERQRERRKNGTAHLSDREDGALLVDDPNKLAKPTAAPTTDDLHSMIISVFIRDKYSGVDDDVHGAEHWMESQVMTLEAEFRDHNINYQAVSLPDHDHVQVLCNDAEEREHIKHLLIRLQPVLCFFMEGKMIFGKFPSEAEKDYFKAEREERRRQKEREERERRKREKAIREAMAAAERSEPDHTDL